MYSHVLTIIYGVVIAKKVTSNLWKCPGLKTQVTDLTCVPHMEKL